jgi:hypothetical protein
MTIQGTRVGLPGSILTPIAAVCTVFFLSACSGYPKKVVGLYTYQETGQGFNKVRINDNGTFELDLWDGFRHSTGTWSKSAKGILLNSDEQASISVTEYAGADSEQTNIVIKGAVDLSMINVKVYANCSEILFSTEPENIILPRSWKNKYLDSLCITVNPCTIGKDTLHFAYQLKDKRSKIIEVTLLGPIGKLTGYAFVKNEYWRIVGRSGLQRRRSPPFKGQWYRKISENR